MEQNVTLFAKTLHKKSQRKRIVPWKRVATRCQRIVLHCQTVVDRCQRIVLCFVVSLLLQAFDFIILKQITRNVRERNLPDYLHHAIHFVIELPMAEKLK